MLNTENKKENLESQCALKHMEEKLLQATYTHNMYLSVYGDAVHSSVNSQAQMTMPQLNVL